MSTTTRTVRLRNIALARIKQIRAIDDIADLFRSEYEIEAFVNQYGDAKMSWDGKRWVSVVPFSRWSRIEVTLK